MARGELKTKRRGPCTSYSIRMHLTVNLLRQQGVTRSRSGESLLPNVNRKPGDGKKPRTRAEDAAYLWWGNTAKSWRADTRQGEKTSSSPAKTVGCAAPSEKATRKERRASRVSLKKNAGKIRRFQSLGSRHSTTLNRKKGKLLLLKSVGEKTGRLKKTARYGGVGIRPPGSLPQRALGGSPHNLVRKQGSSGKGDKQRVVANGTKFPLHALVIQQQKGKKYEKRRGKEVGGRSATTRLSRNTLATRLTANRHEAVCGMNRRENGTRLPIFQITSNRRGGLSKDLHGSLLKRKKGKGR